MALVKSYVHPTIGCTLNVYDDACNCSPEEMKERHRSFDRTLARLLSNPVTRENLRKYNLEHYGHE
jgi:hypothetical protein